MRLGWRKAEQVRHTSRTHPPFPPTHLYECLDGLPLRRTQLGPASPEGRCVGRTQASRGLLHPQAVTLLSTYKGKEAGKTTTLLNSYEGKEAGKTTTLLI